MAVAAIALNRFGLGARGDEAAPTDPQRWLLGQFGLFEASPETLRSVPTRTEIAGEIAHYIVGAKMEGRAKLRGPIQPASATMDENRPDTELPESPRRIMRRWIGDHYVAMNSARLASALTTPAPFVERLVHFWANHFAVSADKLPVVGMAGLLEFEAIRPQVLGRFSDMLLAVEQHPATLIYLDQAQSIGPDSQVGRRIAARGRQTRGLNENLAREILELHTLGVRTGYTQADVTELARALTGWTVSGIARGPAARLLGDGEPGQFHFAGFVHQPGDRQVMGRRYAQSGEDQARAILTDLADHPATARHISTKLARHFAGDEPPAAMVDRLADAFLKSRGDLPTLYRALLDSPEAWAPQPLKFKTPWEWSVSGLRAIGSKGLEPDKAAGLLKELGQPTWKPGSPAGWDDVAASWAAPEALVRRVETAQRLADRAGSAIDPRTLAERGASRRAERSHANGNCQGGKPGRRSHPASRQS
jgi:uncharacterized protein (DUF1800 family)